VADRAAPKGLPTVVATSVIRSAHQGQSHGGVYLLDLETGAFEQVIDWDTGAIDWAGRGGDRGLRGIAFQGRRIFLAASDEVFVFDDGFRRIASISCPYLKHCHEIFIHGETLYLTSTGFDSLLAFDLAAWVFTEGWCLRDLDPSPRRFEHYRISKGLARRLARLAPRLYRLFTANLRPHRFDPTGRGGPVALDLFHINNVSADGEAIHFSGTELDGLFALEGGRVRRIATVPRGTHNTGASGEAVLYHHTEAAEVVVQPRRGRSERFALPVYDEASLLNAHLERDHARQAFGRGLCVAGDLIIAGSSPATVSVFRRGSARPVRTINLTRDVRNAIHGLEVWPFDRRLEDWRRRQRTGRGEATAALPAAAGRGA
jgi:hypothetical protein